jgi:hypothetical protein
MGLRLRLWWQGSCYTDVTYVRVGQSPAAVEKVLERTNKRLEANREPIVRGHP